MPSIASIQASIAPEIDRLNSLIAETLASPNELMNRIIGRYLEAKGKQIRPMMVILAAKLFGDVTDRVIQAAASVELLHNASLIHDDVVDETKLRRGVATVNGLWDNHIAVLVGDFFVASSLRLATATADLRIIDALASLGRMLSVGELDQLYSARFHVLDEKAYLTAIERKTASLFRACVEMGAYAAGADAATLAPLREFGRLLGLCFQIRDDIFDYYADPAIGKPTGNDLREGKVTLPLLYALVSNSQTPEGARMLELSRKEVLEADDIAALTVYAVRCGGIDYAYGCMRRMRSEAEALLDGYGHPEVAASLLALFDYTIDRSR